jgi:hypothetical protein
LGSGRSLKISAYKKESQKRNQQLFFWTVHRKVDREMKRREEERKVNRKEKK